MIWNFLINSLNFLFTLIDFPFGVFKKISFPISSVHYYTSDSLFKFFFLNFNFLSDITSLRESLFEMDSEEETELKATKKITEESVRYFLILLHI